MPYKNHNYQPDNPMARRGPAPNPVPETEDIASVMAFSKRLEAYDPDALILLLTQIVRPEKRSDTLQLLDGLQNLCALDDDIQALLKGGGGL